MISALAFVDVMNDLSYSVAGLYRTYLIINMVCAYEKLCFRSVIGLSSWIVYNFPTQMRCIEVYKALVLLQNVTEVANRL